LAWKRRLDPAIEVAWADLLYDIKGAREFHRGEISDPAAVGVRAPDDLTLVIELESPVAYFLQLVATHGSLPVPHHVVQEFGKAWAEPENIVTNGPFQIESWAPGQPTVLVRNPRYHGLFSGNVQRVVLHGQATVSDRELVEMYEAGGLDHLWIGGLSESEFIRAQQRNASDYILPPLAALFYYGFDMTRPPFDDIRVRRAFAMASTVRGSAASALLRPATGGFVPVGMPAHQAGIGPVYDPEEARQLLAEAGYPGGQGFPEIMARVFPGEWGEGTRRNQQKQWVEGLGIKMKWVVLSWSEMLAKCHEEPPHVFVALHSAAYPDPDSFFRLAIPWECIGWSHETCSRLLEEARRTMDQDNRMSLYRQADRILMDEVVVVPLEYGGYPWLVKPWLTRFHSAVAGRSMFWKDVILELH
jgi:ABC-type oligopeptide transport system substrate-binding subunit